MSKEKVRYDYARQQPSDSDKESNNGKDSCSNRFVDKITFFTPGPGRTPSKVLKPSTISMPPPADQASFEPVKVYARLRPISENEDSCITVKDAKSLVVSTPETYVVKNLKQSTYTFQEVYNVFTSQKTIFDEIARPLVQDFLEGKNGLLFAYGITGSGKTYTMSGTPSEPGILPRVVDVIFNSIRKQQASKFSFKSDHMNGFEVQSSVDAMLQRQALINRTPSRRNLRSGACTPSRVQLPLEIIESETETEEERDHDQTILPLKSLQNLYSVFVTYVQIYNNTVYDLLDDNTSEFANRNINVVPQAKILREDSSKKIYVHNAVEVEVGSAEETLAVFKRGQKKRKLAKTLLNMESSRSHSIFSLRIVQAPAEGEELIDNKNLIRISQLSLVDLAGSERYSRTQATGSLLKEAGSINSSLMQLRMCMELLRRRQQRGVEIPTDTMVPYRTNKLTYYLKSYLAGEGHVTMILCVNPRTLDYEENIHVFEFAELTKEIQIQRSKPIPENTITMTPGRKRGIQQLKECNRDEGQGGSNSDDIASDVEMVFNLGPLLPIRITRSEEGEIMAKLRKGLEKRIANRKKLREKILEKRTDFRNRVVQLERNFEATRSENLDMEARLKIMQKEKEEMENLILHLQTEKDEIENQKEDLNRKNQNLEEEVEKWQRECDQLQLIHEEEKNRITNDLELQRELDEVKRERQIKAEEARIRAEHRERDKNILAVKKLMSKVDVEMDVSDGRSRSRTRRSSFSYSSVTDSDAGYDFGSEQICVIKSPSRLRHRIKSEPRLGVTHSEQPTDIALSNPRGGRGGSEGKWLEHNPTLVPLKSSTVFQPVMKKKKSVQKLINIDDLGVKTQKYCLRTDVQDSDGDVETLLYKADVLPTSTGGAQVVFNDVEILKQVSPVRNSLLRRKRSSQGNGAAGGGDFDVDSPNAAEIKERCAIGIGNQAIKRQRQ